jgi:hypothetical protein
LLVGLQCTLRRGLARLRALLQSAKSRVVSKGAAGSGAVALAGWIVWLADTIPTHGHGLALVARVGGQAGRQAQAQACQARLERERACVRLWVDGWMMAEVVHSYRLQCSGSGMAGRARKLGAVRCGAVQAWRCRMMSALQ